MARVRAAKMQMRMENPALLFIVTSRCLVKRRIFKMMTMENNYPEPPENTSEALKGDLESTPTRKRLSSFVQVRVDNLGLLSESDDDEDYEEEDVQNDPNAIEQGRDVLVHAMADKKPGSVPIDYLRHCAKNESLDGSGALFYGRDSVTKRSFVVLPLGQDEPVDMEELKKQQSGVQETYGYVGNEYVILENLSKGTVDEFLRNAKGRVQLNAQRRIQIMLDVAKVLDSLQSDQNARRAYASISSSNVGLTRDLTPKLTRVNLHQQQQEEGSYSTCDDVQSFGILMIELLTGCLNNDQSEDRKLGDFVERYRKGSGHIIEDDLDPYVRESWTFNILSQLIELALECVQDDATKIPSTKRLVETLSLISSRMQVVECYDWYM
jgi:hypothetical protein